MTGRSIPDQVRNALRAAASDKRERDGAESLGVLFLEAAAVAIDDSTAGYLRKLIR